MPRKTRDTGSQATPHFDGEYEDVINDPGMQSAQMGLNINITGKQNSFHVSELPNDDMKNFEKLTRGKNVE
ncbi:hypothetical protein [Lederbergia panacisoli]|uniref:hypothetical protein n=1 Tax=Lederbergia panacisoli TaxID=1255251 RepID=UPI00214B6B76|nr:hypothetical protein [Lederbergia panacisoli]MCR2823840.1 hypothetical protein [Lederbergia panacisoli]